MRGSSLNRRNLRKNTIKETFYCYLQKFSTNKNYRKKFFQQAFYREKPFETISSDGSPLKNPSIFEGLSVGLSRIDRGYLVIAQHSYSPLYRFQTPSQEGFYRNPFARSSTDRKSLMRLSIGLKFSQVPLL